MAPGTACQGREGLGGQEAQQLLLRVLVHDDLAQGREAEEEGLHLPGPRARPGRGREAL